jgi:hypothetical protein
LQGGTVQQQALCCGPTLHPGFGSTIAAPVSTKRAFGDHNTVSGCTATLQFQIRPDGAPLHRRGSRLSPLRLLLKPVEMAGKGEEGRVFFFWKKRSKKTFVTWHPLVGRAGSSG